MPQAFIQRICELSENVRGKLDLGLVYTRPYLTRLPDCKGAPLNEKGYWFLSLSWEMSMLGLFSEY